LDIQGIWGGGCWKTMSILRFITVDTLCIAAEITAALLLIAFSLPEKKKKTTEDEKLEQIKLRSLEQARKLFLDASVFRSLALLHRRGVHIPEGNDWESHLASFAWEDRLTHLANRAYLDAFLSEWLRLDPKSRQGSALSMLVIEDYSNIVHSHGAIGVEILLRDFSSQLRDHFGTCAIMGRYQPGRFLVLHFDGDLGISHDSILQLRASIETAANAEITTKSPSSVPSFTASIIELGDHEARLGQTIEELDEGINQALENSHPIVNKSSDGWTVNRPTPELRNQTETTGQILEISSNKTSVQAHEPLPTQATGSDAVIATSGSESYEIPDPVAEESDRIEAADSHVGNTEQGSPTANDDSNLSGKNPSGTNVSAVASTEDIAALFEQINRKKQTESSAMMEPIQSVSTPNSLNEIDGNPILTQSIDDVLKQTPETKNISGAIVEHRDMDASATPLEQVTGQVDLLRKTDGSNSQRVETTDPNSSLFVEVDSMINSSPSTDGSAPFPDSLSAIHHRIGEQGDRANNDEAAQKMAPEPQSEVEKRSDRLQNSSVQVAPDNNTTAAIDIEDSDLREVATSEEIASLLETLQQVLPTEPPNASEQMIHSEELSAHRSTDTANPLEESERKTMADDIQDISNTVKPAITISSTTTEFRADELSGRR
jgi:GGDEF domain-containing protein